MRMLQLATLQFSQSALVMIWFYYAAFSFQKDADELMNLSNFPNIYFTMMIMIRRVDVHFIILFG